MAEQKLIKSVSYDQSEILKDILHLYVPSGKIDCDPTYSIGNFYKQTGVDDPIYKFDINPQRDGVLFGDSRKLPLDNESISCEMFDPPFLATTGKSLKDSENNNIINKRFGVYESEWALHQFYIDSLAEAYRVLKNDGILIFKCQDKVSSCKQYMSHCFVYEQAIKVGFYPIDMFVLLAKNRLVADWQAKNQKHSRKFHCYFWVFKKCKKRIEYVDRTE